MRGLYAPPRKNCAPERCTRSATAKACSRLSMPHGPATIARPRTAEGGVGSRERDDRVLRLHVAADQFVRLSYPDYFLHTRHLFECARLDFSAISGDADGGTLGARHGMRRDNRAIRFFRKRSAISSAVACACMTTSMKTPFKAKGSTSLIFNRKQSNEGRGLTVRPLWCGRGIRHYRSRRELTVYNLPSAELTIKSWPVSPAGIPESQAFQVAPSSVEQAAEVVSDGSGL